MWDLPKLVLLRKARHALRDGRLDEAYAIASDAKLGDHRKRQLLLEDLVAPLLGRAREHLDAGRAEDALADIERARVAGGNRPQTLELRDAALGAFRRQRDHKDRNRKLMASVDRHFREGDLAAGAERLGDAPVNATIAADLGRRLERLRKEAEEARAAAERSLDAGDPAAALEEARLALARARDDEKVRATAARAVREAEAALARALRDGALGQAKTLLEKLQGLEGLVPFSAAWAEAIELADKAARAAAESRWSRARVALKRLLALAPEAAWAARAEEKLKAIAEAHEDLSAGPLGRPISEWARRPGAPDSRGGTPAAPGREKTPPPHDLGRLTEKSLDGTGSRHFLWVDGVGSFLILDADRVTLGRHGSSARPDIALLSELDGIHAEILRIEQDYFLVPRGKTHVRGQPVTRHLLADADEFQLGDRCRLTFRMPTSLSPTALLELGSGLRLDGDVRRIILLDGHLIFGPAKGAHIVTERAEGRVILSAAGGRFRCRAPAPILVEGKPLGDDEELPFGAHVEIGSLTFTLTQG